MEFSMQIHSEEEMLALGARLAALLPNGGFLALDGDLGAGKTVLTRGIAAALGIQRLQSPTFVLAQEYETTPPLFHLDIYRIQDENELYAIGYADFLSTPDALIVMEWASLAPNVLPKERLDIHIQGNGELPRNVIFRPYGEIYGAIVVITHALWQKQCESKQGGKSRVIGKNNE